MADGTNSVAGSPNAELVRVRKRVIYDVSIVDANYEMVYFQIDKDNLVELYTAIEKELRY